MREPRIAIIGGGIAGLTAAWELQSQDFAYTLFEASPRLGGKIVSERRSGFVFEGGPDSFLTTKPWAWQLCDELGLRSRLIGTNDAQRNVFILKDGKLQPYPPGMRLIVPVDAAGLLASDLLSAAGKQRMLAEVEIQPYTPPADESLADFVLRHFGPEALTTFAEPLLAGLYVGDPAQLSVHATYPQYVAMARTHGSLILAMREAMPVPPPPDAPGTAFVSLQLGTQELVDALVERLRGDVRVGQPVAALEADGQRWRVNGGLFDSVLITIPAVRVAALLPDAQQVLGEFSTLASASVALGYRAADVAFDLNGFGFVICNAEPTRLTAVTWSSTKLAQRAPADHVLIRTFLGGHKDHQTRDWQTAAGAYAIARAELQRLLGISAQPVAQAFHLWQNPQYTVGHTARVARLEAICPPGIVLTGSSYHGVGVPDVIHDARLAANRAIALTARTQPAKPNPKLQVAP